MERFLSAVRAHVTGQTGLAAKALLTKGAAVRLLSSVGPGVLCQCVFSSKSCTANRTFEGSLSCVDPVVSRQIRPLVKGFTALGATV